MRKHHGKRWEMVRKLGKHNIEGITTIIMQRTKRTGFNNSEYILICTKTVKISTFYTQIHLRLLIENSYNSNDLRVDVNLSYSKFSKSSL